MIKIDIIAIGKLKKGPLFELSQDYIKRLKWSMNIIELESKFSNPKAIQEDEARKIEDYINNQAFVVVMDETGNGLRSLDFANTLQNLQDTGEQYIQFIIGGADGLTDKTRDRANLLLSFGQQTWPHMMVRIMLLEQIYRAQQILAGHPYHRE